MEGDGSKAGNLRLAACALALALLVGSVLFLVPGGRGGAPRAASEPERGKAVPAAVTLDLEQAAPAPERAPASAVREELRPETVAAQTDPWRSELASLTGRVVESDGTPVGGMRVTLLELEADVLFDGSAIDAPEPSLERAETVTDREGRFELDGARGPAFHALGVDLGGPRATLRVIERDLVHRERTAIGDVVLAPYGVLTGRVVDEAGHPVPGARVRAGPFPAEIVDACAYEFRSDSVLAIGRVVAGGEGTAILELPGWMRGLLERLPVPTTASDADGAFRLSGVTLAPVVGGIDKRGYVGVPLGPIDLSDGAVDLGQLVLARGRTIRGVVEDPYGDPVAGAEVLAGAEILPGVVAILQPCGPTDAEGRFELSGVPATGPVVAAARRGPHERWASDVTQEHADVLVELASGTSLTVHVRDEAGQPLSGARIRLRPAPEPGSGLELGMLQTFLPAPVGGAELVPEVEAGRYVCTSLGEGSYDVSAQVPGLASTSRRVECRGAASEVTLICSAGSTLELRVRSAGSSAPIAGARVGVYHIAATGFSTLALGSTDAQGRARLGPLPASTADAGDPVSGILPVETIVTVRHPLHGDHSANLEPGAAFLEIVLESGGTLAGRVHCAGALPTRLYMLSLEAVGVDGFLEVFHLPRWTLTDLAGEFRFARLEAGTYRATLSERFLDQDPLVLISQDSSFPSHHRAEVEIRNGETTELVIDLTSTGRGATARIVGSVRLEGRGLEGADVTVYGNERAHAVTDARGRFETPAFSILETVYILIEGDVQLSGEPIQRMQLYSESVELTSDQVHAIDLDLYPLTLRASVVDALGGGPVEGATVSVRRPERRVRGGPGSSEAVTDAAGEASLLVLEAGAYSVLASAPGFAQGSGTVTLSVQDASEPVQIRLSRAVPCAGRVLVDAARGDGYLEIRAPGDPSFGAGAPLSPPDYGFELEGLGAGAFEAWVHLEHERLAVSFELGPDGDRNLVLVPEPAGD